MPIRTLGELSPQPTLHDDKDALKRIDKDIERAQKQAKDQMDKEERLRWQADAFETEVMGILRAAVNEMQTMRDGEDLNGGVYSRYVSEEEKYRNEKTASPEREGQISPHDPNAHLKAGVVTGLFADNVNTVAAWLVESVLGRGGRPYQIRPKGRKDENDQKTRVIMDLLDSFFMEAVGAYLNELGLEFRHWISIEISACLPIPGRLHPSHYSLLYYSKGKPKTFRRIRTPILICRHCGGEVKDYGGHRDAMNPNGVTLKDVWTDIPPVRHWKFKSKNRKANALSTKILDRVVEMSTLPGDIVLDPFGGSGTTFVVCEAKERRWLGIEIDYADDIIERLETDEIRAHKNDDFVEG